MLRVLTQLVKVRFESERENLMLVARRSRFDALLRMGIFALLAISLSKGFDDATFAYWFLARVATTVLAGLAIARFQAGPTQQSYAVVFLAYVLDATPFFWLVFYLWLSFDPQY